MSFVIKVSDNRLRAHSNGKIRFIKLKGKWHSWAWLGRKFDPRRLPA